MKPTKAMAKKIADRVSAWREEWEYADLRYAIDENFISDLDSFQLDLLTNWVLDELERKGETE